LVKKAVLNIRVEESLLRDLDMLAEMEGLDRSEVARSILKTGIKERKIKKAVELYMKGEVSLARAAEIAGVPLTEMIDIVNRMGIEDRMTVETFRELVRRALKSKKPELSDLI